MSSMVFRPQRRPAWNGSTSLDRLPRDDSDAFLSNTIAVDGIDSVDLRTSSLKALGTRSIRQQSLLHDSWNASTVLDNCEKVEPQEKRSVLGLKSNSRISLMTREELFMQSIRNAKTQQENKKKEITEQYGKEGYSDMSLWMSHQMTERKLLKPRRVKPQESKQVSELKFDD